MITCPTTLGAVGLINGWSTFRDTPDFFDSCAIFPLSVPDNFVGHQSAFDGVGYIGLCTFSIIGLYREFAESHLLNPLVIGEIYNVSMKVSMASNPGYLTATNNIGIRFSTVAYDSVDHPAPIDNFSQVYASSIIQDTINWVMVEGSFVADSSYQYVILGNFFDDNHTDTMTIGNYQPIRGYYIVDDVSVEKDPKSGIEDPNPSAFTHWVSGNDLIIHSIELTNCDASIYNALGQELFRKKIFNGTESNQKINISDFSSGVYFIALHSEQGDFKAKFLK